MKQDSSLTWELTRKQEEHAAILRAQSEGCLSRASAKVHYTIYTEHRGNLDALTSRYFDAFSRRVVVGCFCGCYEVGAAIEIIAPLSANERVFALANEIKYVNRQIEVLVTGYPVACVTV